MDTSATARVDAYEMLEAAARIVEYVYGLRRPRRKLKTVDKRRHVARIAERDGWTCWNCAEPVDKAMIIPDRQTHDAYLAQFGPADLLELVAWVGDDVDKAAAVAHARIASHWLGTEHLADWLADHRAMDPRMPQYADLTEAQRRDWDVARQRIATLVQQYRQRNGASPSIEHCLPVTLGGSDTDDNLALSHLRCNTHHGSGGARNQSALDTVKAVEMFRRDYTLWRAGHQVPAEWLAKNFERICVWLEQQPAHQHMLDQRVQINLATALRTITCVPHGAAGSV